MVDGEGLVYHHIPAKRHSRAYALTENRGHGYRWGSEFRKSPGY
jgi:hypothetical protein